MNRFASACAVILLVAAFFFTGCSSDSYSFVNSVSITDYDAWGIQYDKFNGQQQMEVTLENGTHSFTVDIVTVSGKLDLTSVPSAARRFTQAISCRPVLLKR